MRVVFPKLNDEANIKKIKPKPMSYEIALEKIVKEKVKQTGELNLSGNELENIPEEILELRHLHSLNLSYNRIADASLLEKLINLQSLNLKSNKIESLNSFQKLINLRYLNLSSNSISIVDSLENLTKLKELHLASNQIKSLNPIHLPPDLSFLDLTNNKIENVDFLEEISNCLFLLRYNKIEKIGQEFILDQLFKIQFLDVPKLKFLKFHKVTHQQYEDAANLRDLESELIRNNRENWPLSSSSDSFQQMVKSTLFNDNPLVSPPLEILSKRTHEIKKYYEDLAQQGKTYLFEAKLLIVGDGGAGKTSLVRKIKALKSTMPKEGEDRTKGIDVQALSITNIQGSDIPFLMNIWDFGGQGYYHSTHQFFLTKRSLYVLINNTRTNKTDFNDWLQTISLFSDNSPVILVENEVGGSKSELDERGLRQFFNNIIRVKTADISNTSDGRLQELIHDIQTEIQRLPHVGSELPKQWVKIREELKEVAKKEAHISDREFHKICARYKITDKEPVQRLGDLFHDLGIFLHFRDDRVLKRIVILQNSWVTKGVYTILDDELVRAQNGYFTIQQAEEIWSNTLYEDWYDEMVSLMEKFRLCYRIPYSTPAAYISPNLLPIEKPEYSWDQDQNLVIHYDYEFMPKGLLGMLIVELHRYVKDIQELAWRTGCIFHYQNTDAQVIETYGNKKLEIRVKGAHCVHLSTIIICEVDKLNVSFNRIKVKKKIPCPCRECKDANTPYFFDYDVIMRRKEKNKLIAECQVSFEDVDVLEILEAAYDQKYIKAPTIRQLVRKGKLKEAIDTFEEDFPDEGTLLLSRYNQLQRLRYIGTISNEDWNVNRNQIAESLLEFSKLEPSELPKTIKAGNSSGKHPLEQKLDTIQGKLVGQDLILNEILNRSQVHQDELLELLGTLESKEKGISEAFATDIIAVIERGMTDFMEKVPDAKIIIADWQEASKQLKLAADSKVKLKWTIPFLFMKLEKEVAWNGKDYFRAIKEDIQRGVKGDWSEMFMTKEE